MLQHPFNLCLSVSAPLACEQIEMQETLLGELTEKEMELASEPEFLIMV